MMSTSRNGNFTSSEIFKLMSNGRAKGSIGAPAFEYVKVKNRERRLGRSIQNEVDAKALSWGKLIEGRAFDVLGLDYSLCSQETLSHPEIKFWKGSPDATKQDKTVGDIKCPMTLNSFCELLDPFIDNEGRHLHDGLTIEAVRENHKDGEKFFWQIVSNAVLTGSEYGELIVYCPYRSELEAIRELASSAGIGGEYTKWINFASDEQLPHLIEGMHYKNINVIRFDILQRDKDALTERVLELGKLLIDL